MTEETPEERNARIDRERYTDRDAPFTEFMWVIVRGYSDGSSHPKEAPVCIFKTEVEARRYMAAVSFPYGAPDILDVVRVPVWS